MMWFEKSRPAKNKRPSPKQEAPQPKELHVPHNVEMEISAFLVQHGRLEMRIGRQLMHFSSITRNGDGSVDYVVRSRMHTHTGLERNFESRLRIHPDHRLQLLR
ncbi:MAG TPA: hypothetical protein VNF68_08800 [Candidatus Baltobacteraceae bacterium]|nr:hypothetical protein [Candidatus Baltobacteraceae bacterium]